MAVTILPKKEKSKKEPAKSNIQKGDLGKKWGNPDGLKLQKVVHAKLGIKTKIERDNESPQQNKTDSVTTIPKSKGHQ